MSFFPILANTFSSTPAVPSVVVSGAGTNTVDGTYDYYDMQSGKPRYTVGGVNPDSGGIPVIYWNGTSWLIFADLNGDTLYSSTDDTSFPWEATFEMAGGDLPVPTVSEA